MLEASLCQYIHKQSALARRAASGAWSMGCAKASARARAQSGRWPPSCWTMGTLPACRPQRWCPATTVATRLVTRARLAACRCVADPFCSCPGVSMGRPCRPIDAVSPLYCRVAGEWLSSQVQHKAGVAQKEQGSVPSAHPCVRPAMAPSGCASQSWENQRVRSEPIGESC